MKYWSKRQLTWVPGTVVGLKGYIAHDQNGKILYAVAETPNGFWNVYTRNHYGVWSSKGNSTYINEQFAKASCY